VNEIDVPLYQPNSPVPTGGMHFIYGHVDDGSGRRYGWMAEEAMRVDGSDGGAGSWAGLPGAGIDIGSGGGQTWLIGTNPVPGGAGIYHWNGISWDVVPGGAVRISVDNGGHAWVINNAGNIFYWTGSGFAVLPGLGVDIGVGGGQAWLIGTNQVPGGYGIYHWNGGNWDPIPGGAVRIAVDNAGHAWVVNNAGNIYYWNGGGFVQLPGGAIDIAVNGGQAWVIGTNRVLGGHGIYHWNGAGWDMAAGGANGIAVDTAGHPWVVNDANGIFYRR
jgi:hypothetical protein